MLFRLRTDFTLPASRAAVYEAVRDVQVWPQWWRGCERVIELEAGRDDGVGARHQITWRSRLPYRVAIEVEVTSVARGEMIRGSSRGDLDGVGTWRFLDAAGGTHVQYLWEVSTRKRWMRLLAPVLAPLFRRNHDWLMQDGAAGLARHLNTSPPRVRNAVLAA
jgi:uncharacterized protein YndB with AHSA1/START domain